MVILGAIRHDDAPTDANFGSVSCGRFHNVGLRTDGTVVTWGDTTYDQRDDAPTDGNFVAISCGLHHSGGLRAPSRWHRGYLG